jgi:hypothetical protein
LRDSLYFEGKVIWVGYNVVDLDSKLKELSNEIVEDLEVQICDKDNIKFILVIGDVVESSVRDMLTSNDVFLSYRRDSDNLNVRDANDTSRSVIVYIEPKGRNCWIIGDSIDLKIGIIVRNHVISYKITRRYSFSAKIKEHGGLGNE